MEESGQVMAERLIDRVYELRGAADDLDKDAQDALRRRDVVLCDWLRGKARTLRQMADEIHITCK